MSDPAKLVIFVLSMVLWVMLVQALPTPSWGVLICVVAILAVCVELAVEIYTGQRGRDE